MSQVKKGDTVQVHYTGKLDDGTVFDSSQDREPLAFVVGEGRVIPGFEQGVIGMEPAEAKTIKIASDEAYGSHRAELILTVSKEQFPDHIEPAPGMQLQLQLQEGQPAQAVITEVSEAEVTLDANHPLAGQDLTFDIQLVAIA
jgi:FKBP-type peptidyl-prolyl cis-trans isomerase 2